MEANRITADMIAPCGLDCSLCKRALAEKDPCHGILLPEMRHHRVPEAEGKRLYLL